MKERFNSMWEVFSELFIGKSKMGVYIKTVVMDVAWVLGLLIIGSQGQLNWGSAYLVFTLSLLIEYAERLEYTTLMASKIILTVICILLGGTLILSLVDLAAENPDEMLYKISFWCIVVVMVFTNISMIIMLILGDKKEQHVAESTINDWLGRFYSELNSGELGSLKEDK